MNKKNKIEGLLTQAWYLRGIGNYNESKKVLNIIAAVTSIIFNFTQLFYIKNFTL
jgi:hypothetical protein